MVIDRFSLCRLYVKKSKLSLLFLYYIINVSIEDKNVIFMPVHKLNNLIDNIALNDTFKTITFQADHFSWQREAVLALTDSFFQSLPLTKLIEIVEGADRMSARFSYQQQEFILHIECTCESIWIEAFSVCNESQLGMLFKDIEHLLI